MLSSGGVDLLALSVFAVIAGSAFLFTDDAKTDFPPLAIAALRLTIGTCGLSIITAVWWFATRGGRRKCGAVMPCRWWSSADPDVMLRKGSAGSSLTVHGNFLVDYREASWTCTTFMALAAVGVLNTAIPYSLYAYAMDNGVTVGVAAVLSGASPLITAALAACTLTAGQALGTRPRASTPLMFSPRYPSDGTLEIGDIQSPTDSSFGTPRASDGFGRSARTARACRMTLVGLVLGFTGIVLLSVRHFIDPKHGTALTPSREIIGHLLLMVAVTSKSAASVVAHKHLHRVRLLPLALSQTAIGAVVTVVLSLAIDFTGVTAGRHAKHWSFLELASSGAWGSIFYLGLASSCLVYILQFFIIKRAGAVRQMVVDYMTPVVGVVEGAVFKAEFAHVTVGGVVADLVGVILVAAGVALVNELPCVSTSRRGASRTSRGSSGLGVGDDLLDPHAMRPMQQSAAADRVSLDRDARRSSKRLSGQRRPKAFSTVEAPTGDVALFAAPEGYHADAAFGDV